MHGKTRRVLGTILTWALVSATLLVTPGWSFDPINPIKMLAVTAFACFGLGALLANRSALGLDQYKFPFILIISYVAWLHVVLVASNGEKFQQIFGTNGRNTGLITYVAFSILFVVSMVASTVTFFNRFLTAVFVAGIASLGYGLVQATGGDPFDWVNPYAPVFGFLGNPNFQSSLLGILGSIVFAQLLSSTVNLQIKAAYFAYLLTTLYVIRETESQQGFLVLLIGASVSLGIRVIQKSKALGYSYLVMLTIGFVAVLVGVLNKGPLASLLYKDSVTYRGDYWRAGWKMTLENPIFGVGLDSYGDWYRRSRTIEATLRRGPEVTSNSAHNVFLDVSSSGGFPLLIIYISLLVLVVFSAVKVLKRSQEFNAGFVGLFAGWVAFQAQSVISINQIGLALWGWVLSGLIIGYEINSRGSRLIPESKVGRKSTKPLQMSASTPVAMFAGLAIGVLIGIPPYLATAQYKGALESGNPTVIQDAAYLWPIDSSRMVQIALILNQNKLEKQGLQVAIDAVERFPDNYGAWRTLSLMKETTEQQQADALAQMKRLDPLNPTLK